MARSNAGTGQLLARYSSALYFVAALMLLMPPLDVILSLPRYAPGNADWRWGAIGVVSGAMLLPIMGVLLASMTAVASRHRWMNRLVIAGAVLMALVLFLAAGLFVLDGIQLRPRAAPEVLGRYDLAVVKTVIMQLTQVVALLLVARSGWRAGRSLQATAESAQSELVGAVWRGGEARPAETTG